MRINRLVLRGYRNLSLASIRELDLNLDSLMQLILGTNGSGKSSLLRQCNPLPISPGEFTKEGFKEIHIDHHGDVYLCRSVIHGKVAKHSLYRNDEPLCEDATSNVYKEHIERELGYTATLHKLLIQSTEFTRMTPAARQDTLTAISNLDLTYALRLFDRLRQQHRDTVGAVKHLEGKVEGLHRELSMLENREEQKARQAALSKTLADIRPFSLNHRVDVEDYDRRLGNAIQGLQSSVNRLPKEPYVRRTQVTSFAEANQAHQHHTEVLHQLVGEMNACTKQLEEMAKHRALLENTDNGEERLVEKLKQVRAAKEKHPPVTEEWTEHDVLSLERASHALYEAHTDLPGDALPCNKKSYQEHVEAIQAERAKLLKMKERLERMHRELRHAEHGRAGALDCPQCQTKVYPAKALDDQSYNAMVEQAETLSKHFEEQEKVVEQGEGVTVQYQHYVRHFNRVARILSEHPYAITALQGYDFDSSAAVAERPKVAADALLRKSREGRSALELMTLTRQEEEIAQALEAVTRAQKQSAGQNAADIEKRYHELKAQVNTHRQALQDLEADLNAFGRLSDTYTHMEGDVLAVGQEFADWSNSRAHYAIECYMTEIQTELGALTTQVDKAKYLEGHITALEDDLKDLRKRRTLLAAAIMELSPKDGFIAEQMQGFIGDFVQQMNSVIAEIWEYELQVLPCGIDKGKLDYRFPVKVEGETVPDIAETSKGQQEIINFAFTVVMLAYKGLSKYPLFLDEVGGAFDHRHRGNFIRYIKQLLEARQCEQLFIVNHFSSDYGGLTNADVLVLSNQNIVVPREHNTHATITLY